jgi:hypothetical protein
MEYSESETLMVILQDQVPGGADTLEAVTVSIIISSVQVPPLVPHCWVVWDVHFPLPPD